MSAKVRVNIGVKNAGDCRSLRVTGSLPGSADPSTLAIAFGNRGRAVVPAGAQLGRTE